MISVLINLYYQGFSVVMLQHVHVGFSRLRLEVAKLAQTFHLLRSETRRHE